MTKNQQMVILEAAENYLTERGVCCELYEGGSGVHKDGVEYLEVTRIRTAFTIYAEIANKPRYYLIANPKPGPSVPESESFDLSDPDCLQQMFEFIMSKRWK